MTDDTLTLPPGAPALLAEARQEIVHSGELIRLVMAGVGQVDSWLIEHRLLPVLREAKARALRLSLAAANGEEKEALLIPLPDGSAFARSTSGRWFALEPVEATAAIEHIGFRYAPQDHWEDGFQALLELPGKGPRPVSPFEVAALWKEVTGCQPSGFEDGLLDEMEAVGLRVVDMVFDGQGQLGL